MRQPVTTVTRIVEDIVVAREMLENGSRGLTAAQKRWLGHVVWRMRAKSFKNNMTIAEELGCNVDFIKRLISKTIDHATRSDELSAKHEVDMQVFMLEQMLQQAWDAWIKSTGQSVTVTERAQGANGIDATLDEITDALSDIANEEDEINDAVAGASNVNITRMSRKMNGDPRFLSEMRSILTDLRKLKGIADPPKRSIVDHNIGGRVEVDHNSRENVGRMDSVIALLVQQGVLPVISLTHTADALDAKYADPDNENMEDDED